MEVRVLSPALIKRICKITLKVILQIRFYFGASAIEYTKRAKQKTPAMRVESSSFCVAVKVRSAESTFDSYSINLTGINASICAQPWAFIISGGVIMCPIE